MRRVLLLCLTGVCLAQQPGSPVLLPTRYDADRFYLEPVTTSGRQLNLFTDTGGGLWLNQALVDSLGLPVEKDTVAWPALREPAVSLEPLGTPTHRLGVVSAAKAGVDWDGMLGQQWFAGRIWTFDYPAHQLWLRAAGDQPEGTRVELGFPTEQAGGRGSNFPRIALEVEGKTLPMLFDTGATVRRDAEEATSFLIASHFDAWHRAHPEWPYLEKADRNTGEPMLEVPEVTLAGFTVGPVWFTRRADKNFREWMASMMDAPVDGAVGGNILRYFRVTVDYPKAEAWFER